MRSICFLAIIVFLSAWSISTSEEESPILKPGVLNAIEQSFTNRTIEGCFIIHDLNRDTTIIYNPDRAAQAFLPASTFKILNSMIALECNVVEDENEVIFWDSVDRPINIWNQDHNLRTGIKYSVVWMYKELARRIGKERMGKWVDRVDYGNRRIEKDIDNFWLVGDLRITPLEQIAFLKKFVREDLPFKKEIIKTVKEILIEDENDSYVFRAKTGWVTFGVPVGWYVGYIEINGETYIFVNNIEIRNKSDGKARKEITKEVFKAIFQIDLAI